MKKKKKHQYALRIEREKERKAGDLYERERMRFFNQEKNAIGDLFRYETANHDKLEE